MKTRWSRLFFDMWKDKPSIGGKTYGIMLLGLGFKIDLHRKKGQQKYKYSYWEFKLFIPYLWMRGFQKSYMVMFR